MIFPKGTNQNPGPIAPLFSEEISPKGRDARAKKRNRSSKKSGNLATGVNELITGRKNIEPPTNRDRQEISNDEVGRLCYYLTS